MTDAICLKCGSAKDLPLSECVECGFDPQGDSLAEAKSIYWSVARFDNPPSGFSDELNRIANLIRAGKTINYNQRLLDRIMAAREAFEIAPWKAVLGNFFHAFLPGVAIFVIFFALKALLAWLK